MASDEYSEADDELSPELVRWAECFIEGLADTARILAQAEEIDVSIEDHDADLLEQLSDAHHDVLAHVGIEYLTHADADTRWAAVWCLGEARYTLDETVDQLISLLWNDPEPHVRSGVAWALAHFDELDVTLPNLIKALADASPMVSGGAIESLMRLGPHAKPALPALIELARNPRYRRRALATLAIAEIDADDPEVQSVLADALTAPDSAHAFAAYGLGLATATNSAVVPPVASLLSEDHETAVIAAWTLRRFGQTAKSAVPSLLNSLKRSNEYGVDSFKLDARPEFWEALVKVIEDVDDPTLAEFRLLFFDFAFRNDHAASAERARLLSRQDFYLKVQRKRFGTPTNSADRQLIHEFMQEGQDKFAKRLLHNPTLSLPPDKYYLLPKWIKQVTRSIASNFWRSRARARTRAERQRVTPAGFLELPSIEREELLDLIFSQNRASLTEEERIVAGLHYLGGHSLTSIAEMLPLSQSQIRTRRNHAKKKISAWIRNHS